MVQKKTKQQIHTPMKIFLHIFLFFTLSITNAFSQNYLNETSKWYFIRGDVHSNWYEISKYQVCGDTIIADREYHEIFLERTNLYFGPFGGTDTLNYSHGTEIKYLRSEDKKFYSYDATDGEYLVFDFHFEMGDELHINGMQDFIVDIDTIFVGAFQRQIFTTGYGLRIYEGIGTDLGLFNEIDWLGFEGFSKLKCFYQNFQTFEFNSSTTFGGITVESCDELEFEKIITSLNKASHNEIKIFPNPFNDLLNIKFASPIEPDSKIIISNMSGKHLIQTNTLFSENQIAIDVSSLSRGIYILTIILADKIYSKKIIKM